MQKIRTKEDYFNLFMRTKFPDEVLKLFEGIDFLRYMNECRRIVERAVVTDVKTYSWRLSAPRSYNYYIGYFSDIHNAKLKINKNWLKLEMDEDWWKERIQAFMKAMASWVKRIYYMNEYEEKEKLLDSIRDDLMEKGLDWSEDETYNEVYNRKRNTRIKTFPNRSKLTSQEKSLRLFTHNTDSIQIMVTYGFYRKGKIHA